MNNLLLYGWNDSLLQQKVKSNFSEHIHGRVSVTHKTCYEVVAESGNYICELTGNMLFGKQTEELPCTGDWVIFQEIDDGKGIIFDMLPRQKTLYRLKSGSSSEKQALASFVDKGFIVQSLDNNFNVRRVERTVLQMANEGITPVLILSKSDLDFNENEVQDSLKHLKEKLQIFYTSIDSPESIEKLRNFINLSETIVFTGSSGVGKSTLINLLCKNKLLETSEISKSTGKGKHTSTRREMVLMDKSGVLIDTPGIKVFGVTDGNEKNLSEILDISTFENDCRFKDCSHTNEKGCAVIQAVKNGDIDESVYNNFIKLRKESWHYNTAVHEKRKKEKSFAKMVKEVKTNKSKFNKK